MGLFGAIVQPLFVGGTAVLMPPFAFVQRPSRWLRAIQDHGGTMAGGPNFGYELCVRRVQPAQAATLDLSSLEVLFCGAEPIRAATLRRFAEHFAPAGFAPSMFLPCYGLAEATLLVSAERPGTGPREILAASDAGGAARVRVSCGVAPSGCRISIRDPQTGRPIAEGTPGEVCVAGAHVAIGEWQGEGAKIGPLGDVLEDDGTRWLRTGDVGLLSEAGLLVLDRLKDVIFCYGRNVHATDVEGAALDCGETGIMAAAAFAVEAPAGEELVLICEISVARSRQSDVEAERTSIVDAVAEQCGVAPRVVFVAPGVLPRTTSGKIRRQVARKEYREGRLRLLASVEG
jgi:acyl-CoA synthetase (AMP-forming)/AMP-acid ligase II